MPGPGLRRGVWVAVAAVVVVLVLVGSAAWLFGSIAPEGPATSSTTVVTSTTVAPTTLGPDPSSAAPEELAPELVAEVVTSSSIGDARWTVYEDTSFGDLKRFAEAEVSTSQDAAPTLPASLLSSEGIVTETWSSAVATAGETTLTQWAVGIDWKETVLLQGGDGLAERSDDGDLLLLIETSSSDESGSVEAYLFTNHEELQAYQSALCCDPGDSKLADTLVATYDWTNTQLGDGWLFEVLESASGEPVGSVTSPSRFYLRDDRFTDTFFTASQGGTAELTTPPWFGDFEWFALDSEDSMLVYAKAGDSNSYSSAPYEIWRSGDGVNWQNLGSPTGFRSEHLLWWVSGGDGLYVAQLENIEGDSQVIRSENGIDWGPVGLPSLRFHSVHRVDAGWVALTDDDSNLSILTSPDGTDWEPIDTSQIEDTFFRNLASSSGWTSSGNRQYVVAVSEDLSEDGAHPGAPVDCRIPEQLITAMKSRSNTTGEDTHVR